MSQIKRLLPIDILRSVACFMVVLRHTPWCPYETSRWLHHVTLDFAAGGWVGVDLFFVISGYLISGLLFNEQKASGHISVGRFYFRRGFKIYPPFWALLLAYALLGARLNPNIASISKQAWYAEIFFFQNYVPGFLGITWSLAVEEHFYIFLPLLLVLLSKFSKDRENPFKAIPYIFGLLAAACLAMRVYNARAWPQFDFWIHHFPTHLRIDSLFFGVLLSYYNTYFPDQTRRISVRFAKPLLIGGCLLLLPPYIWEFTTTPFIYSYGFTLFYIGSGMILMGMLGRGVANNLPNRVLGYIGSCSYSIYLWHVTVLLNVPRFQRHFGLWPGNWYVQYALSFPLCIVFGVLMSLVIEQPMLKLRNVLAGPRRQVPTAPGVDSVKP